MHNSAKLLHSPTPRSWKKSLLWVIFTSRANDLQLSKSRDTPQSTWTCWIWMMISLQHARLCHVLSPKTLRKSLTIEVSKSCLITPWCLSDYAVLAMMKFHLKPKCFIKIRYRTIVKFYFCKVKNPLALEKKTKLKLIHHYHSGHPWWQRTTRCSTLSWLISQT